ncbi:T9SS type A sorting domain-containing protein [Flavitalea flava]
MKQFLLFLGLLILVQTLRSQTSYTWNGTLSTAWNTPGNWTPNGIPGAADNVTIVTGGNNCLLNANAGITNFKLTTGTLDLGGFILTVGGTTATFTTGTVQNGTLTVSGASTTAFGNGPVVMNCIVSINSAAVTLKNTTFQNTTTITKTGATNDGSPGGNIFNGPVTMNNLGAGYLLMGNGSPDQFNATATFNNTGSNSLYVAYNSSNNIFNGVTTFNNSPVAGTGILISSYSSGTLFNDNIVVTSTNGQGVLFCNGNATATATLAATKTITIGAGGFSAGTLQFRQFTQTGATAQNLALTGTGNLTFGPTSTFAGDVTVSTPTIYLNSTTFNGASSFTKTGTTGDWSPGGNVFNGVCNMTNSGGSYFLLGSTNPDIWNNDVTFTDNGSERLLPCWSSTGNQFNGNIYVNTSGSATGIQFCGGNATATATLAATKTIQAGATGLTAGYLYLKQFTQAGNAPINITATGTSVLYLGPFSNFGGVFSATAPDIWAQGATYSSPVTFTKTGGSNNHNNQNQNIFQSTCSINQQSNTGYFMLGYNSNDLFNDDIILTSTASGGIYLGWTSGTGTPAQAAGKTIFVGAAGFSAGFLSFNTFTQSGNAPINLTFSGANTYVRFARGSVIGGDLTTNTPDIYFNGCTFNGNVDATKTGAGNDASSGGNVFQGSTSISNPSTGYIILGNGTSDTWNNDVTFNSSGSSYIAPGWNSAGNSFNGNITVSSTGSSTGIQFCSNAAASASLAAGYTIQTGLAGFSSGTLLLRQFTQAGSTAINLNLTGATTLIQVGPASGFGGSFTAVSPRILLNGAVFSDIVSVTKTGATGEWSSGGNTFNSTLTINQQGGGYFGFANGAPDIYNGDVYANNNSTDRIIFGNNPVGNQFNGNIILTQIGSSSGIAFGWSASTNETMAAGKTISIGAAGYSVGYLQIMRFTQLGNTPMNLPLTGSASLTFGPSSAIGGDLTSTSGSLYFNGCTFNGTVNATKTGVTNDGSSGNNIFNDAVIMTNAGSGYLLFGNGNADQFNAAATFNNTGNANLHVAYNSANNIFGGITTFNNTPAGNNGIYVSQYSTGTSFNDNIVVASTNGQGVQFCGSNTTSTATLAASKTISIGSGGFSTGILLLKQFTQVGATAQNLTLTGTANLTFGPNTSFGGDLAAASPTIFLNTSTFNGTSAFTKTGATGDYSPGGNTFNGVCTITNSGNSYFLLGNSSPDTWNSDVTFTDNGLERLLPCWASAGNQFNGNIYVNTSGSAQGIQFCGGNTTATATLAATKSIQTGSTGLKAGYLILKQFTQAGNAPINLTLSSTATYLQYGPASSLGGDVTSTSPGLYFQGCTFNGSATCLKNGASNDASIGNNVFNGVATMTDAGSGYLLFGNGNADQFNTTATFNNTGSNAIYVAYNSPNNYFGGVATFNNTPTANTQIYVSPNSTGTVFANNIIVNSTSGQGILFCSGNGSATATLAAGRTISVGAGGFSSGTLLLRQFTQTGGTAQNITLTGTGNLTFGPLSNFGGNVTSFSPALFFNGCIFSASVNSTKTGTTNDQSAGNNTFNGAGTFTNTGTGYLLMTVTTPDIYNGNAAFVQANTGLVYPNYNGNSNYNGNLTVTSPSGTAITFGSGTGTATLSGSAGQTINASGGTPAPVFTRLIIANTGSGVTLNNTSINVSRNLTLSSGLLNTSTTYILTMLNGSSTAAGNALSTSYVNGPMRYQKSSSGASILNFPIGNAPDCRPVILTINHSSGNLYTYQAQLFNASAAALGYTLPPTVDVVSSVHYYTINRVNAASASQPTLELSGNQTIEVFFGANDDVINGGSLTVVKNTYTNLTKWIDIGGIGGPASTGAYLTGSITSTSAPTAFNSFSTFALGNKIGGANVLPVGLIDFSAKMADKGVDLTWETSTENNNDYFAIEKSKDGLTFDFLQKVPSKGVNGNSDLPLTYAALDPNPYAGVSFYRLKQTDLDGKSSYSNVVSVSVDKKEIVSIYPNPTTGTLYVSGLDRNSKNLSIEWFDAGGRRLLQETVSAQNGMATLHTRFNNGIYFLRILFADGTIKLQNVIIMK